MAWVSAAAVPGCRPKTVCVPQLGCEPFASPVVMTVGYRKGSGYRSLRLVPGSCAVGSGIVEEAGTGPDSRVLYCPY